MLYDCVTTHTKTCCICVSGVKLAVLLRLKYLMFLLSLHRGCAMQSVGKGLSKITAV